MKRYKARITTIPVYTPPKVVLTPLALLTAPLERAPDTGMELTKELAMLQMPNASISWVASMVLPSAGKVKHV